jgi:hypothetical protein
MSTTYIAVKNAVYPYLKNYQSDLLESDKEIFERYAEDSRTFFHASRATGTDLFIPSLCASVRDVRVAIPFLLNSANDRFIIGRTNSAVIKQCSREYFIEALRGPLYWLADNFSESDYKSMGVDLYQAEACRFLIEKRKQYFDSFLSFID